MFSSGNKPGFFKSFRHSFSVFLCKLFCRFLILFLCELLSAQRVHRFCQLRHFCRFLSLTCSAAANAFCIAAYICFGKRWIHKLLTDLFDCFLQTDIVFALLLFLCCFCNRLCQYKNQLPLSRLPAQASAFSVFCLKAHTPDRAFSSRGQPLSFCLLHFQFCHRMVRKASPDPDEPLNRRPGMDSPRSDFSARIPCLLL